MFLCYFSPNYATSLSFIATIGVNLLSAQCTKVFFVSYTKYKAHKVLHLQIMPKHLYDILIFNFHVLSILFTITY